MTVQYLFKTKDALRIEYETLNIRLKTADCVANYVSYSSSICCPDYCFDLTNDYFPNFFLTLDYIDILQ